MNVDQLCPCQQQPSVTDENKNDYHPFDLKKVDLRPIGTIEIFLNKRCNMTDYQTVQRDQIYIESNVGQKMRGADLEEVPSTQLRTSGEMSVI